MTIALKIDSYLKANGRIKTIMTSNGLPVKVEVKEVYTGPQTIAPPGMASGVQFNQNPYVTYRIIKRGRPTWETIEDFNAFVWPTGI